MTVYITKVWGFTSPSGPLQFSVSGWRDRAREVLRPGDLVVLVGTMGQETSEQERGRILGLLEPTRHVVSSLDYDLARGPQDYNAEGSYRWPYGLEVRNAWRFREPLSSLSDLTERRFYTDSAMGIVPLDDREAEAILRLPHDPIPVKRSARTEARISEDDGARWRAAILPTYGMRIMQVRRVRAFTYAMTIDHAATAAIKIGWAFNYSRRERDFNQAAMPALGGLRYRTFLKEEWDTATEAFRMEQALLRQFDERRHPKNREILTDLTPMDIQDAWINYLAAKRRRA